MCTKHRLHAYSTMAFFRSSVASLTALWLALATIVLAQQIYPSNNSADIPSYNSSPRFWVNGSEFAHFSVVPLGWFASISQANFVNIYIDGRLMLINSSNANNPLSDGIIYLSCDPQDYPGVLGPSDVLGMAANAQPGNAIVLYSTRANHCQAPDLRSLAAANGVFSTLDPVLAATVADQVGNSSNGMPAIVVPDFNSYHINNNSAGYTVPGSRPGPTTAVAMIILYTITGLITALFVVIIVTGAIRAHRHPERYGPSNIAGRPRRSRAKGIARAMLDTIPIVKFGEKEEAARKEAGDIELATVASTTTSTTPNTDKSKSATVVEAETIAISRPGSASGSGSGSGSKTSSPSNPDGTDESGHLGCSICTEDFNKGEEVRVLPCNHKFHPECVDPWLLNVSGTCPLCRVDLRPKEEQEADAQASTSRSGGAADGVNVAPPLGARRGSMIPGASAGRRDTTAFATLRSAASASREDRIAALRRFRQQMRGRGEQGDGVAAGAGVAVQQDEERRGLSARLRERFRVRTGRQGEDTVDEVR